MTPPEQPAKPWERQPTDTGKSWEAFLLYRDAGPTRSLAKVAGELKKSAQLMHRWSNQHDWRARALAWDRDLDQQWRDQLAGERRIIGQRHLALAQKIQSKVIQRLQTLQPAELTPDVLLKWAEASMKVERIIAGLDVDEDAMGAVQILVDPRFMPGPTVTLDTFKPST